MDTNQIFTLLANEIPSDNIMRSEPMKEHTSFKIGGPADLFVTPTDSSQLMKIIQVCNENHVPYYIIGNGSNLLVSDKGIRGVVIQIYKNLSEVEAEGTTITAYAGVLLSRVATVALESGLGGFEFAHGIPGTLGGAVAMNAGAYGGEMKDVVESVQVLDEKGNVFTLGKDELAFGYRKSVIQEKNYIVLKAKLKLCMRDKEQIASTMKELAARRREKQPLEMPSAGSTFKRPEGFFAGKLIMDSGLRGYQIGGARVSDKHCGFVVNTGDATCEDVVALIEHIQKEVWEKFHVALEPEVKRIGER